MRGVLRARVAISLAAAGSILRLQYRGRTRDDARQFRGGVEGEFLRNAEAVLEGAAEQAVARGGADEREGLEIEPHRPRRRPLVHGHVNEEVLHRRVQVLFKRRAAGGGLRQ